MHDTPGKGFPGGTTGKEPTCQCRTCKRCGFDPWVGKIPWRRAWQSTPVFLPGESHGQKSLWATVHRVAKSQTPLRWLGTHAWCTGKVAVVLQLQNENPAVDIHEAIAKVQISSFLLLSYVWLFATPWTAACQASVSIPTPGAYSNSCSLSRWCHPTISSSVVPFSPHLQSFPASGSFPMSQFFASGGQRIGVSASASILPMNIQDWFPLEWTGLISLQSKRLSSLLQHHSLKASILPCSTFVIVQLSHPYMTTWKTIALTRQTFVGNVSTF